jgi:hypothetical protein
MPDGAKSGNLPFNETDFLEEHFYGPDGLLGVLAKHGLRAPQRPAVVKWFTRGSVPGDWWPTIVYAIECENGAPISMARYFGPRGGVHGIFG